MNALLQRFSLRLLVAASLAIYTLILAGDTVLLELPAAAKALETRTAQELADRMTRMQGTLNRLIRTHNTEGIRQEISFLASRRGMELVLLLDENYQVIASSRYALQRVFTPQALPDSAWELIKQASIEHRGLTRTLASERIVEAAFPVWLEGEGQLRNKRLGTLLVIQNFSEAYEALRSQLLLRLGVITALLAAVTAFLWWLFSGALTRPVRELIEAAKALERGAGNTRVAVSGSRETAALGEAFNAMASAVLTGRNYLRQLLDSQPNIVVINDGQKLIDTNRAFFRFFDEYADLGAFRREHECVCELFEPTDRPGFLQPDPDKRKWINTLKSQPDRLHKALIMRDGAERIFSVHLEQVPIDGGTHNIVTFVEITEQESYQRLLESRIASEVEKRREQERQLLQQAKIAQMGEMLTGIAHHWRQPLNLVALNIQDVLDAYDHSELTREYLEKSIQSSMTALEKMSATINSFRELAASTPHKTRFQPAEALQKTIDFLKAGLESHFITLQSELDGNCELYGDAALLEQSIHNLILNAQEALVERKSTRRVITLRLKRLAEHGCVEIVVEDTAGGIDPAVLPRIFDPFFTTKETATKTGTGLYFAKRFIEEEFGGTLQAENTPEGARFSVVLPEHKG